jgi:ribonuclease P protein component
MLPPRNRLRLTRDHRVVARRGAWGSGGLVVMQLFTDEATDLRSPTRAGVVVGRAVGGAVTRNAVRRRLRQLIWERLDRVPPGSLVVVRARAEAGTASNTMLADDLDTALDRAVLSSRRQSARLVQRGGSASNARGGRR